MFFYTSSIILKLNNCIYLFFQRFNVAMTRAKDLLIIIGNPHILREEKYWYTVWQYCEKNNATIFVE